MKKIISIIVILLLSLSCVKLDNGLDTATSNVSFVSFNYVIDDMKPGNPIILDMPDVLLSQLTDKYYELIHKEFYERFNNKIHSGDLIDKQFTLNLTEVTTGEKYQFTDRFDTNNIYLIKPGTYEVSGKTYQPSGYYHNGVRNCQKCLFTINDKIIVKKEDTQISLKLNYDCFLLIITDNIPPANYVSLYDGYSYYNASKLDDYYYYILSLKNDLMEEYNDRQYIDKDGDIYYLKDYPFENGKYYIIPATVSETTEQPMP